MIWPERVAFRRNSPMDLPLSGYVLKFTERFSEACPENYPERYPENCPEDHVTRQELAKAIGITDSGVKYHLKKMQEKGLIRRVGPDKGGHWEVVK